MAFWSVALFCTWWAFWTWCSFLNRLCITLREASDKLCDAHLFKAIKWKIINTARVNKCCNQSPSNSRKCRCEVYWVCQWLLSKAVLCIVQLQPLQLCDSQLASYSQQFKQLKVLVAFTCTWRTASALGKSKNALMVWRYSLRVLCSSFARTLVQCWYKINQ